MCFRRGRHFSKFSSRQVLEQLPLKQLPSSWSPLLLAQLLIVLKEFLNLHPLVCSPRYHTKFPASVSFKIWDPPHNTLGSSVMLSPVTLKVFYSRSLNSSHSSITPAMNSVFALCGLLRLAPNPICGVRRTNSVAHAFAATDITNARYVAYP